MPKLTEKLVAALAPEAAEYVVWDTEVTGLGVRVRPAGSKSFILVYRRGGKKRKHTMGPLRADYGVKEARDRAGDLLHGLRSGVDPQHAKVEERGAISVSELADAYLEDGPALKPEKKDSSWDTDRGIFKNHIKPLIGRILAREVTKNDVAMMQLDISKGKIARSEKTGHRRRSPKHPRRGLADEGLGATTPPDDADPAAQPSPMRQEGMIKTAASSNILLAILNICKAYTNK